MSLLEPLIVTLIPAAFLIVLLRGGYVLHRQSVSMEGVVPIQRTLYLLGKLSMVFPWGGMLLRSWGLELFFLKRSRPLAVASVGLWALGFAFLFAGRLRLGRSFRIGIAREPAALRTGGIYRISRNPMYLGIFITLLASSLYTLNGLVVFAAFIVALVHHKIALAEEVHLAKTFGREFEDYRSRVRRYL